MLIPVLITLFLMAFSYTLLNALFDGTVDGEMEIYFKTDNPDGIRQTVEYVCRKNFPHASYYFVSGNTMSEIGYNIKK